MTAGFPQPRSGPHSGPSAPGMTGAVATGTLRNPRFAQNLAALLLALAHATQPTRVERLISDVIEHTEPLTWNLALTITRRFNADRHSYADDFAQCVRLEAVKLLRQIAGDPQTLAEIGSYQAVLSWRARNAADEWWTKFGPRCVLSGQVSRSRRLAELNRTRALMAAEGQLDPSAEEVLARHNARVGATRKDAARQGMLASASDLAPVAALPLHEEVVATEVERTAQARGWSGIFGEEPLLPTADRRRFVAACISACASHDEQYRERTGKAPTLPLAKIAARWFAEMAAEDSAVADLYDGPPDVRMLAAEFGVSTSLVYQAVKKVRLTSGAIATEFFIGPTNPLTGPRTAR